MSEKPVQIVRRGTAADALAAVWPELLSRFVRTRDEEAFAGLVHQFGPMVLGVCRRILGHTADADDSFQAVFVVLARQAGSLRDATTLPAWLHRVALRTSRKARTARDHVGPAPTEPVGAGDPFAEAVVKDTRRVLDEELDALPDKFRGPIVLCWLDGLTQDEAASRLGLSLNTLKRRLGEGRDLLRSRLTGRGLVTIAAATAVLDPAGLRSAVPDALTALAVAAGQPGAAVSARVESLVVRSATRPTRRALMAAALGASVVATGGLAYALISSRRPVEGAKSPPTPNQGGSQAIPGKPLLLERNGPAIRADGTALVFTSDGKSLISGGAKELKRWSVETGREEADLNPWLEENVASFLLAVLGPGGRRLLVLEELRGLFLIDVKSGKGEMVLVERGVWPGVTSAIGLSPSGDTLVFAHQRRIQLVSAARLWAQPDGGQPYELTESDHLATLPFPDGYGSADFYNADLVMRPDGTQFATPGSIPDKEGVELKPAVFLWDLKTHRLKTTLSCGGGGAHVSLAFSPNGQYLARGGSSVSGGVELKVWDLVAGTDRVLFSGKWKDAIFSLAFHPDNTTLLSGEHQNITQWDVTTGQNRGTVSMNARTVQTLVFNPDGTVLASASMGANDDSKPPTVQIWKVSRSD